jgi:enoyl-[acyl-carrier protein] reductase III
MDTGPRHFEAAMNTNVRALLSLVQSARTLLERKEGRAKVIALSSHGSDRTLPMYGMIGTSKAALESLVRHLALELGNQGINFNVLLAGLVETDSTRRFPNAEQLFAGARQKALVGGRPLTSADVADAALFLASPLSDLVQGQVVVVDGGEGIAP